jgi:hypothetical protein
MELSINDEEARDLELSREIQTAREVFLNSAGDERSIGSGYPGGWLRTRRSASAPFLLKYQSLRPTKSIQKSPIPDALNHLRQLCHKRHKGLFSDKSFH